MMKDCIKLYETYRAQYEETQLKLSLMPKGKQFDFFDWLFDALDFSQTTSFFI